MEYSLSSSLVSNMGSLGPSPSLDLRFGERKTITAVKGVTPTFARGSTGTFIGDDGRVQTASSGTARIQRETSYLNSYVDVTSIDNNNPVPSERVYFSNIDSNGYPVFTSAYYQVSFNTSEYAWYIIGGGGEFVALSYEDISGSYSTDVGDGSVTALLTLAGKGLIIEESSSNLIGYSTNFGNTYWSKTDGINIGSASILDPSGDATALSIIDNGSTGPHHIHDDVGNFTPTVSTKYCMSCYVRYNTAQYVQLAFWLSGFGALAYINFDIKNKIIGSAGTSITSSGIENIGNGWLRIWAVAPATVALASGFQLCIVSSNTATRAQGYAGDYRQVFLWGTQVEAKAFPTSFIKTTTASSAPRSADVCNITSTAFTGIFNALENSVVVEGSYVKPDFYNSFYSIDNGTANYQMAIIPYPSGLANFVVDGGSIQSLVQLSNIVGSMFKSASSSKADSFQLAVNGTLGTKDTTGTIPSVNNMKIGRAWNNVYLNGIIKSIRLYQVALPDSKLKSLTA